MAILSNINGKFAVDSTGAVQFSGAAGTSGYILKSNGTGSSPTWVDPSTVIGGPYLPLSGGTLTGATATASGISFTFGGTAQFDGDMTLPAAADNFDIGFGLQTTGKIRFGNTSWNNSLGLESYWMVLRTNQNEGLKLIDSAGNTYVQLNASNNAAGAYVSTFAGDIISGAIAQAKGFRTETGSTDYSLLTRNSSNTAVYIQQAGSGNIVDFRYGSQAAGQGTSAMLIDSSGNVGIGIAPVSGARLTLGTGSVANEILSFAPSTGGNAEFRNTSSTGTFTFTNANGSSEKIRIDSSGNVGIGTSTTTVGATAPQTSTATPTRMLFNNNYSSGYTDASLKLYLFNYSTTRHGFTSGPNYDLQYHSSGHPTNAAHTFYTNNNFVMRVGYGDTTNVGIGTTAPSRKLYVGGAALIDGVGNTSKGTLMLGPQTAGAGKWSVITGAHYNATSGSGNGSGSAGIMMIGTHAQNGENDVVIGGSIYEANAATSIQFWTHTTDTSTAGGTRRMTITSAGNVGIGTPSPASKLEVYGNVQNDTTSVANSAAYIRGADVGIAIGQSASSPYGTWIQSQRNTDGVNFPLSLNPSGSNVGIGTLSPAYGLEINGSNFAGDAFSTTRGTSRFYILNANNSYGVLGMQSNHDLHIRTNATTKMLINSSGNVGIGTTSPSSYNAHGRNLVVAGSGNVGITIDGASTSSCSICFADGTSSTASIAGKIEYDHSSDVMEFRTVAVTRMALNSSSLTVSGDIVAYGSPSDKRLKENIKPIKNPLGKIKKLKGVTFDWKQSNSILDIKEDYGFIAQDVQKIIPELVRKNENELLSMRHQGIIPILVEAIKELEARVKELENK